MKYKDMLLISGLGVFMVCFCLLDAAQAAEVARIAVPESARRVSMDFENADLKLVLKVLSQQSGLNFVSSQDAENKKVTVFLSDVSVNDAIDAIVRSNGLRYEIKPSGNIFMVYAAEEEGQMQTRVFPLKFLRLSISSLDVGGQSVSRELSSKIDAVAVTATAGAAAGAGAGEAEAGEKGQGDKLTAERGVDKLVASLLSEHGKVAVDIHSNSLVVTDLADKLAVVEAVLARLDVAPRQVLLEAQILETQAGLLENQGIEWGDSAGKVASYIGPLRDTKFPLGLNSDWTNASRQLSVIDGEEGSAFTFGALNLQDLTATLNLLISHSDTKILARPRVLALNNEAAAIKLVTNTAVALQTTIVGAGALVTSTSGEAQRQETGIVLKMTPQINADDSIILYLEPSVTTVATSAQFPDDFLDPTTRSVRTSVMVQPGQTLVIGGLVDTTTTYTDRRVPLLGEIPILGRAFRNEDRDETERELVMFITPTIVSKQGAASSGREQTPAGAREKEIDNALRSVDSRQTPSAAPVVGE